MFFLNAFLLDGKELSMREREREREREKERRRERERERESVSHSVKNLMYFIIEKKKH